MRKRVVAGLIVLGVLLLFAAFYLGSEVFPGVLGGADGAASDDAAAPERSAAADVFAAWGMTAPDNIDDIAVVTPENAPLAYLPLDSAFLASLVAPVDGRLVAEVLESRADGGVTLRIVSLELMADAAGERVVRSLALPVTAVIAGEDLPSDALEARPLAKGDYLNASVMLRPGSSGGAGRLTVQALERVSGSGNGPSS